LAGLGITVRELTGDMQLTKTEIMQTQVIHPDLKDEINILNSL